MPTIEKSLENISLPSTALFSPCCFIHIPLDRIVAEELKKDLRKMFTPSLLTKAYGRGMMVGGVIHYHSFGSYILLNLQYAGPVVALIAAAVVFGLSWYKYAKHGTAYEQKYAKRLAAKEAAKTFFKFLIVYMFWTMAMSGMLAAGFFAGPYIIAAILIVALATGVGFFLATWLTESFFPAIAVKNDRLSQWLWPESIGQPKGSLKEEIWQGFLKHAFPTLWKAGSEGSLWAACDGLELFVGLIKGIGGVILDVALVTLLVSTAILVGSLIFHGFKRLYSGSDAQKKLNAPSVKTITEIINTADGNYEDIKKTLGNLQQVSKETKVLRCLETIMKLRLSLYYLNQKVIGSAQQVDVTPDHKQFFMACERSAGRSPIQWGHRVFSWQKWAEENFNVDEEKMLIKQRISKLRDKLEKGWSIEVLESAVEQDIQSDQRAVNDTDSSSDYSMHSRTP